MKTPFYILAASTTNKNRIKNLFESGNGSVMELLRNPGQIRPSGWDLRTYDAPQIKNGEYLEVTNIHYKTLHLYEDGAFVLKAIANQEFLCWGVDDDKFEQNPKLNPLPLIELTYNFVDFYFNLVTFFEDTVESIKIVIEMKNLFVSNTSKIYLYEPYFEQKKEAPEDSMKKIFEIRSDDSNFNVGYVTFKIIEKIYTWFTIPIDQIPYSKKDQNENYFIDKEEIIKIR